MQPELSSLVYLYECLPHTHTQEQVNALPPYLFCCASLPSADLISLLLLFFCRVVSSSIYHSSIPFIIIIFPCYACVPYERQRCVFDVDRIRVRFSFLLVAHGGGVWCTSGEGQRYCRERLGVAYHCTLRPLPISRCCRGRVCVCGECLFLCSLFASIHLFWLDEL